MAFIDFFFILMLVAMSEEREESVDDRDVQTTGPLAPTTRPLILEDSSWIVEFKPKK
jgi:hypothetical protein